jgi:hypothetical protein
VEQAREAHLPQRTVDTLLLELASFIHNFYGLQTLSTSLSAQPMLNPIAIFDPVLTFNFEAVSSRRRQKTKHILDTPYSASAHAAGLQLDPWL